MEDVACLAVGKKWHTTPCCFVLSTGRCGTKTLAQVLALAPQIDSYHEPPPKLIAERQSAFWYIQENPEVFARILQVARQRSLSRAYLRGKLYAETSPRITFFAPVISDIMKNARFIYLHRHPGEVVRSAMRRGWYSNHMFDRYRIYPDKTDPAYAQWQSWGPFEKCCWYWQTYNRFALNFRDSIRTERILTVASNDLFDPDSGIQDGIFKFLGIDAPPSEAIVRQIKVRFNKQQGTDFPVFAHWSSNMKRKLEELAGPIMYELGYEM